MADELALDEPSFLCFFVFKTGLMLAQRAATPGWRSGGLRGKCLPARAPRPGRYPDSRMKPPPAFPLVVAARPEPRAAGLDRRPRNIFAPGLPLPGPFSPRPPPP